MPGSLPLDDGRYLIRSGPAERILVTETEGALPPPRRRRRRPRKTIPSESPVTVTIAVVTVVRANEPFGSEDDGDAWLGRLGDSELTGDLLDDATATLDRARAADAAASGTPFGTPTGLDSVLAARIGYGDGDQVASGRYLEAMEVDARGGVARGRRERIARAAPLARTAAILGARQRATACEVLIPRIRLDLEAGNEAAACLTIAPAIGATIAELEFAVEREDHERDLDQLEKMLPGLTAVTARAQAGHSRPEDHERVDEALDVAERVIRRRRVLDQ